MQQGERVTRQRSASQVDNDPRSVKGAAICECDDKSYVRLARTVDALTRSDSRQEPVMRLSGVPW